MDILIQNKGQTELFKILSSTKNGTTGVAGRISFKEDNAVTKISEELYNKKIKNDPFFKRYFENGTLVVLNNVGIQPSQALEQEATARELNYSRYKNLVLEIEKNGGKKNEELAEYLDDNGLPNMEFVRSNMGQVDPQKVQEYQNRFMAEKEEGILSNRLRFPGGKLASSVSKNLDEEIRTLNEKNIRETLKNAEVSVYSKDDLESFSREELVQIAKSAKIEVSEDAPAARLVGLILKSQRKSV